MRDRSRLVELFAEQQLLITVTDAALASRLWTSGDCLRRADFYGADRIEIRIDGRDGVFIAADLDQHRR